MAQWAFFAWAGASALVVSSMMAGHLLTLPTPDQHQLAVGLTSTGSGWRAVHVLAKACGCSQRVLQSLLEHRADAETAETILFIGDDPLTAQRARAAGFEFETLTAAQLESRYGVQGAPLLVVVSPQNAIVYSGGYAHTEGGPAEDRLVLARAKAGQAVEPLPQFGCAVSRSLQKKLDPLALKYAQ